MKMRALKGIRHALRTIQVIPCSKLEKRPEKLLRVEPPVTHRVEIPFSLLTVRKQRGGKRSAYGQQPCQKQIYSPVILVMNRKRHLDATKLVSPPSFHNEVLGKLDEKMSPKPQVMFERAASHMLT